MIVPGLMTQDDDEEETPSVPGANEAPIIDDEPAAPVAPAAPGGTTLDDATLNDALQLPADGPGASAAPGLEPIPDLAPSAVPQGDAPTPPPGARQKFTRTIQSPEDKAIAADQAKLTDAAITAEKNKTLVEQAKVRDEQKFRAEQTAQALEHQKRLDELLKHHDEQLDKALQRQQEYFDAARAKSYEQVMGPGLGDRILGALAIALGGLGGGQNQALQIYDNRMKQAYAQHQAEIDGAWKIYEAQGKNVQAARDGRENAITDLNLLTAARHEAAADQLEQMKIAQGIPAAQAAQDANVVAIRQKALDIRRDEAKKAQDKVEWDTYGKARGAGGGGGGANKGLSELIAMKEQGKPDSEIAARAAQLGIAPKVWAPAIKEVRVGSNASARLGLSEDKQVTKEASDWAKANGLTQIEKQQRELSELQKVLHDQPNNPLAQALAVEKAVSAARGGAASRQALDLALHHLGGSLDNAEAFIQKIRDGQLAPGQRKNFMDFLNGQISTARAAGKEKYDAYEKYIQDAPADKREGLLGSRGKLFSGMLGYGESAAPRAGAASKPAVTVPADHGEAFEKLQRAKAAAKNPSLSPSQRAKAQAYIDQYQEHVSSLGNR